MKLAKLKITLQLLDKQHRLIFLMLFFSLNVINTTQVLSQSIDFKITECLVYVNNEINLEFTREARNYCKNELVITTFYPETDIVELEMKEFFRNEILKMKPIYSTEYLWEEQEENQIVSVNLKFNRLFGYLRSGEIIISGRYEKEGKWFEDKNKHLIKFERK